MSDDQDPLDLARRIAEDLADDGPTSKVRRQGKRLLSAILALEDELQPEAEDSEAPGAPS